MPLLAHWVYGVMQTYHSVSREVAHTHTLPALQGSHPDVLGQGPDLEWELLTVLGFSNGPWEALGVSSAKGRCSSSTCRKVSLNDTETLTL